MTRLARVRRQQRLALLALLAALGSAASTTVDDATLDDQRHRLPLIRIGTATLTDSRAAAVPAPRSPLSGVPHDVAVLEFTSSR